MPSAEDFATTESAAALAARIRRKEVSPVEVVDAAIARIETHNPKINALIIFGYDDARKAAKAAEAAIMRGDEVGPLHGVPVAMKDCFDFKPGWVTTFGGIRALKNYVVDTYCMFVERMEKAGRDLRRQDQQPGLRLPRHLRQLSLRPVEKSLRPDEEHRRLLRRQRRRGGGRAAAALRRHRRRRLDPHPVVLVRRLSATSPSFGRVPLVTRPEAFGGNVPFIFEGPITRTVEDAALAMTALAGYDSRDPYCIEGERGFHGRAARLGRRQEDRLYARLRHFPGRPARHRRGRQGGRGLRGGGRACRGGGDRHPPLAAGAERRVVPLHRAEAGRRARRLQARRHRPRARSPRRFSAGVLALGRDRAEA